MRGAAVWPMEASMPAQSATNSAIPSPVPPDVQALFGAPPLLRGEDAGLYDKLMVQFTSLVEPKDMIEWWWVKDITDHSWEIRRLRRFKVLFVELQRDQLVHNRELLATVGPDEDDEDEDVEYVPVPVPDSESDSAELFKYVIDQYKNVDKLVASAELRRGHTLREIERRREHLARRLRKASDEIIDGEHAELPQAAE
jgi:hypothetical protein